MHTITPRQTDEHALSDRPRLRSVDGRALFEDADTRGPLARATDNRNDRVRRERLRARNVEAAARTDEPFALEFGCECADHTCSSKLPLDVEHHRHRSDRFIVAVGDQCRDTVVGVADGFFIVEVTGGLERSPSPRLRRPPPEIESAAATGVRPGRRVAPRPLAAVRARPQSRAVPPAAARRPRRHVQLACGTPRRAPWFPGGTAGKPTPRSASRSTTKREETCRHAE